MNKRILFLLLAFSSVLALSCVLGFSSVLAFGSANAQGGKPTTLMTKDLPDVPGKEGMIEIVDFAPGEVSQPHRHNADAPMGFQYFARSLSRFPSLAITSVTAKIASPR